MMVRHATPGQSLLVGQRHFCLSSNNKAGAEMAPNQNPKQGLPGLSFFVPY